MADAMPDTGSYMIAAYIVTAVVVLKPGVLLDEAAVIAHCAGQLAHFKVPKGVVFVDALPKNPSGKLLKRDLRMRFEGRFGPA